ncbi:MAG: VWA domain-containing protein [Vicinamibacterales bacterium]
MKTGLFFTMAFAVVTTIAQPSQQPTFRSGVTLVTTDVIPRDQNGRFVSDLARENFTVLEDGQPQAITSFFLVHGGRTFNLFDATAPTASTNEGIVLPPTRRRTDDSAGRVLLIFVDDLHFEPEASPGVRKVFQTLVESLVHEGDIVAVVSSGPSSIEIGPTYDRKLVVEAMTKIRGSGLLPSEIFKMLETSQGPGDIRARAQMAFYTAYNMLGEFEKISNKRKAVVYISMGYDFDPFAEGRHSRDRVQGGRFSDPLRFLADEDNPFFRISTATADLDLHRLMRELTLSANRANATIYTVDPRGLSGVVDAGQYVDQSEVRTYLQKTQSTLRYLAEETGGFPIVNTNDFASAFKRVDAETSDYYVLGFSSSNPDPVKRVRTLEVKVSRPNVTVSSRREYSLKTEGTPPTPPALKPTRKR